MRSLQLSLRFSERGLRPQGSQRWLAADLHQQVRNARQFLVARDDIAGKIKARCRRNGCDIAFAHQKPELSLREVGPQGCKVGLGLGRSDPRTPLPAKFKLLANRQGDLCRT